MHEMRLYFEHSGAVTPYLRRKCLYLLPNPIIAAVWLYANPGDLWEHNEEERHGWMQMHADLHVETVELNYSVTGFYDEPEDTDDMLPSTRVQVVGLTRARQERFFGSEWVVGDGVWEQK